MKKFTAVFLASLMLLFAAAPMASAAKKSANTNEGGLAGFLIGCLFGIRSAAAYNDGKDLHWREWIRIIPIANLVGCIYDGMDGMNGVDSKGLADRYGASYY